MAFYTKDQLLEMGFAHVGENVFLSDKSSYYNCKNIYLGSNVRIDDFCIISAGEHGIRFDGYNHIACYCSMIGKNLIHVKEFTCVSSKSAIYSSTDDYSGAALIGPTMPDEYRNVISGDVILEKHVILGAGTVVLPNVNIGEGVAVGALSLITKDCDPWSIYVGVPVKKVKDRKKTLLQQEQLLKSTL